MNEELEKTKPIKTLKEINTTRSEKHLEDDIEEEITSREEKYAEKELEKENTEMEEAAEEALAEKNINKAEKLLKEEEPQEEPPKKGLINKIKNLSKKGKIILFTSIGLVLLIIIIILVIVLKPKKPTETNTQNTIKEEIPTIVDNFYYKEGKLYILDETQKTIGEYECTNKDEKLCFVAINKNNDTFDNN